MSYGILLGGKDLTNGYTYPLFASGTATLVSGPIEGTFILGGISGGYPIDFPSIGPVNGYVYSIDLPVAIVNQPLVYIRNTSAVVVSAKTVIASDKIIFVADSPVTFDYMIFLPSFELPETSPSFGVRTYDANGILNFEATKNNLFVRGATQVSWVSNYNLQSFNHGLSYTPFVRLNQIGQQRAAILIANNTGVWKYYGYEYMGVSCSSTQVKISMKRIVQLDAGSPYTANIPMILSSSIAMSFTDGT